MLANDILTPEEAAAYLKLNPRTVQEYLRDGLIPARKIGRFWRVSRQCLDDWLGTSETELSHDLLASFDAARAEAAAGECSSLEDVMARQTLTAAL
jgi:excisionase family DNA binding protein